MVKKSDKPGKVTKKHSSTDSKSSGETRIPRCEPSTSSAPSTTQRRSTRSKSRPDSGEKRKSSVTEKMKAAGSAVVHAVTGTLKGVTTAVNKYVDDQANDTLSDGHLIEGYMQFENSTDGEEAKDETPAEYPTTRQKSRDRRPPGGGGGAAGGSAMAT